MIEIVQTTSQFRMRFKNISLWRYALFKNNGLALLSAIGILTGVATSLIIAGFMLAIELSQQMFHGTSQSGFAGLPPLTRFLLPIGAAILLIVAYKLTAERYRDVGIAHVIDRLQRGRGKQSLGNAGYQWITAIIALTGGFSMGKEGPAVHVGSAIASKLGLQLRRSPSQIRLLSGCGTAAAISAAFGTPLAGVMFAMEVVLMEYSLTGFIPIIAAAVTAAVTTQAMLGEHPAFIQIDVLPSGTLEFPSLVLTGIATGIVGALLHRYIKFFLSLNVVRVETRYLAAGLITGILAIFLPQIMGLGYQTMDGIISGQYVWWLLIAILLGKVTATAAAVGFGIPAGIVAPSLVIGMATGAIIGYLVPGQANDSFYALIGMAGLMSALLHAPIAALTAVLELSLSAEMMFPAMIVVVLANLTCQVVFHQPSIYQTLLSNRGLHITTHPLRNALASRYLTEIASENFVVINKLMDEEAIAQAIDTGKRLVILRHETGSFLLTMNAISKQFDDWRHLPEAEQTNLHGHLMKIIPDRSRIAIINEDQSLLEGIRILQNDNVVGIQVPIDAFRIGLVTRHQLTSVLTTEGELH